MLQTSLDDFYVAYEINAYTDQPSRMAMIYSELHQNIQDQFNEAGVEIMSPHYDALRDGNRGHSGEVSAAGLPTAGIPAVPVAGPEGTDASAVAIIFAGMPDESIRARRVRLSSAFPLVMDQ